MHAILAVVAVVVILYIITRPKIARASGSPRIAKPLPEGYVDQEIAKSPAPKVREEIARYIPEPTIIETVEPTSGHTTWMYGDFHDPAGTQHATVVIDNVGHGMSWGGWDPEVDHSAAVAELERRIAANPNDAVAIGQLQVMRTLGLKGT